MSLFTACFSGASEKVDNLKNRPKYVMVGELGSGKTGVVKLMRHRKTKELVAVKFIERHAGDRINRGTEREIINHRKLAHPNIIRFKEVFMTDSHLAIVMDYASGGHLADRVAIKGRFAETEARAIFVQVVAAVGYCHEAGVFHRDLKLENVLLDGDFFKPTVKISNFGYSKSAILDSQPKTSVGSPAYMPPEMLLAQPGTSYQGAPIDVWHLGVLLFVMLTGTYPFQDPAAPNTLTRKVMLAIVNAQVSIPEGLRLSPDCVDLISRIFVADPVRRISVAQVQAHPWVVKAVRRPPRSPTRVSAQSVEEIQSIVAAAAQTCAPPQEFNEDDVYETGPGRWEPMPAPATPSARTSPAYAEQSPQPSPKLQPQSPRLQPHMQPYHSVAAY